MKVHRIIPAIFIVCYMCSCNSIRKGNSQTTDKPTVIKSEYNVSQQKDPEISPDSTLLSILIYNKGEIAPVPYMGIEIINLQYGYTQDDGQYTIMIPKGVYKIRVHNYNKFETKNIKIDGGTRSKIIFNLGNSIWICR